MHTTIFTTPVINTTLRWFSILFLRLTGWTVEGALPSSAVKSVFIAAPHTSNWDLPYTLMVAFVLRLNPYWMGKQSLFRPPVAGIMKWLGGIPVNREQASDLVAASSRAITEANGPLQLIVPPEGTRSKTRYWKTGFYYIALSAKVPIIFAFMDYADKRAGLGPVFEPTGDVIADMASVKAFYRPFRGRNPDQFTQTE